MYPGFWPENLKERDLLEGSNLEGRKLIKCIFKRHKTLVRTGFVRLKIGTTGGLLQTR